MEARRRRDKLVLEVLNRVAGNVAHGNSRNESLRGSRVVGHYALHDNLRLVNLQRISDCLRDICEDLINCKVVGDNESVVELLGKGKLNQSGVLRLCRHSSWRDDTLRQRAWDTSISAS